MELDLEGALTARENPGRASRKKRGHMSFLMSLGMQRVYELLAIAVALFFPASLLTWLVIDKFIATGEDTGHVGWYPPGQGGRGGVFSDRSRPGA
jgi:hypothetical protein